MAEVPVWVIILLVGVLMCAVFGFLNVYVPKDQKILAKKFSKAEWRKLRLAGGLNRIDLRLRYKRFWYLILAASVSLSALIAFFLEGYFESMSTVVQSKISRILLLAFAFVLATLVLSLIIYALEDVSLSDTKEHYRRRYGVEAKWWFEKQGADEERFENQFDTNNYL